MTDYEQLYDDLLKSRLAHAGLVSTPARGITNPEDPVKLGEPAPSIPTIGAPPERGQGTGGVAPEPQQQEPSRASLAKLTIVPMSLTEANEWVKDLHRHNAPLRSFLVFAVGVRREDTGQLCGAALVGHASSKKYEDGYTLEVRRAVTDGTANANSALYGACARAAKALGYRRLYTFTLIEESGASLRASGWTDDGLTEAPHWQADGSHMPDAINASLKNPHMKAAIERGDKFPLGQKRRWVKLL